MGNLQSTSARDETRRFNRLSKPPTKKLAPSASQSSHLEPDRPELLTGVIGWQNPWVGSQISRDVRASYPKATEIPPTLFEAESGSPVQSINESPALSLTQSLNEPSLEPVSPHSGSFSANPSLRRASYQSGTWQEYSQAPPVQERPRRAISIQTSLQRHKSVIYESPIEEATSSNTAFLVGNQRFSLTRRRSLLTRPGVATRRTTGAVRRVPSPIGEPESCDDTNESQGLQWPLPPREKNPLPVLLPARPTSPVDPRYTQLGALKLGSLRVVNGSASPCSSDRIPFGHPHTTAPGLGLKNVETAGKRGSTLEIPIVSDVKKSDDVPGSPFSFEKSPIMAGPRSKPIFPGDEDEGIAMCDVQLEQSTVDVGVDQSTLRSLNKSDSGYSSATSIRSLQRSRTRASLDSQASSYGAADSSNSAVVGNDQFCVPIDECQRHFSLQEAQTRNFSRMHLANDRWYDGNGPATQPLAGLRARRSTLCAPRYTEYPKAPEPSPVDTSYAFSSQQEQTIYTRRAPHDDHFYRSALDVASSAGSSTTLVTTPSYQQLANADRRDQAHRSTSGYRSYGSHEWVGHSRSRSRHSGRIWSQKPGIHAPPLPTILSPDHLQAGKERGEEFPLPETYRGRPRSRSHDYRRKSMKERLQPEMFI
ncbi:uncharacterized protein N7477_005612 [Penicillium maclennaniae]|uniref:uncharacterized protein n=1 Tax=Penicillium maclennaniae TaxID=1343394 RepID=UPI0025416E2C|nr:uncharacterized protein N7477_005612 [Penicillium maclennaniae]KAJ5670249.1 hypothetical protein N7477_005612 [Penicillium maclennaniae]